PAPRLAELTGQHCLFFFVQPHLSILVTTKAAMGIPQQPQLLSLKVKSRASGRGLAGAPV
ncbi:MAG TPA: hypothetical protein VE687_14890, partial [Stellaceae bacterium]|nr:hypothetical protein [Stellaceae bacterium]